MEKKDNNKKDTGNNSRFNSYWIYGLLALFLLALNFYSLSNSGGKELAWNDFSRIVQNGDIRKIEVVNDKTAYVYLKESSIDKYPDASCRNWVW